MNSKREKESYIQYLPTFSATLALEIFSHRDFTILCLRVISYRTIEVIHNNRWKGFHKLERNVLQRYKVVYLTALFIFLSNEALKMTQPN